MAKDIKFSSDARSAMVRGVDVLADTAVSYTHLTLPTIA